MQQHLYVENCVEAILSQVGTKIILGVPIAIGKPNHLVNALYERAKRDSNIDLTIFTGLTFIRPKPKNELEQRFGGPLIERLFAGYPELDYAIDLQQNKLPANVQVHEFFMQAGAFLNSPQAQQSYTSLNYTHVTRHLLHLGVNVVAQLVAADGEGENARLSLGSNTDISLDLLPALAERKRQGMPIVTIAQINKAMPFMEGEAVLPASSFDYVINNPDYDFPLFGQPKEAVTLADYAAALHIAALIKDGGTIQLGIGTFSDALAHALILRHTQNTRFRELVYAIGCNGLHPHIPLELAPFEKGLYGATELFVDGYLPLYHKGILKRRVFDDEETQARADAGALSPEDYEKGALLHAGFMFGSKGFYEDLHQLTSAERAAFRMTAISKVNHLYGAEPLRRAQRKHARFVNSAMMATLQGDVISDQLADGRVVSGVGGQYNFVAQAHELDDGRSIIQLKATRLDKGRLRSNIHWSYGHTTIPRHLKDIVVTEYGAVDLRGLSDRDTIAAMLNITDTRFQPELLAAAKQARKIERGYQIPGTHRDNTAARLQRVLGVAREDGTLPAFPFGSNLTFEEQALMPALNRLKAAQGSPLKIFGFIREVWRGGAMTPDEQILLARLGLASPQTLAEHVYAAMVLGSLRKTG